MYRLFKRIFDILCSLFMFILSSPLWLIIFIGIKISSRGPLFYKTERIGKNKEKFILYKFRSMHVYHSDTGKKSEGGYIANSDRIFPFGKFLRKSKLDELPQILNILLGEMSVIGPRPITITGVEKNYIGEYQCILSVKPGLACLDSLFDYAHGEIFIKDNEEYAKKIVPMRNELARMYVERRSIKMDIYCIFRTAKLIFQITVQKRVSFLIRNMS